MRQKILDNVFLHVTINLIWNLGLWFFFIYGGSISTARSQHFWSSSYHIAIVSVLITLIGRWTTVAPKSYLSVDKRKNLLWKLAHAAQTLFWSIVDFLNFLFWLIFDAWRKPSVEVFARMSATECTKAMVEACKEEIAIENENPITGYFGKAYFSLLKWSPTPFGKITVFPSTVLYGKMNDVKQGMFIRAWHRLPISLLLFLALWFGGVTSFIVETVRMKMNYLPDFAAPVLTVLGTYGWLLFFMWISTKLAWKTKNDLKVFLLNIFSSTPVAQHSVHRTAGTLRVL